MEPRAGRGIRRFRGWFLCLVPILSACSQSAPPGVVLVVVDTLRRDAVGAYGAPESVTPYLDVFAGAGTRYDEAIAHASWTLPSTASMLTGAYPATHGAGGSWSGEFTAISTDLSTVAERLASEGVRTHGIVNGAFVAPRFGMDRGFETYDFDAGTNARIRRAEGSIRRAITWLSSLGEDAPFFLYLHLFDPHLNYDPLPRYQGRLTSDYEGELVPPFAELLTLRAGKRDLTEEDRRFVRGLYGEEVFGVDAALGVFFEWLEQGAWLDRSVVIVTSDHGEEFWEHGGFEHGHALYEELVRIPLLIRSPEGCRGCDDDRLASQADIGATILDVFGVEPDDRLEGRSLLSDAATEAGSLPLAGLLYAPHGQRSGFRTQRWKLVAWDDGRMALYDLATDPGEVHDVSSDFPDTVAVLAARLEEVGAAASGSPVELDEEDRARLQALGYIQ